MHFSCTIMKHKMQETIVSYLIEQGRGTLSDFREHSVANVYDSGCVSKAINSDRRTVPSGHYVEWYSTLVQ